MTIIENKVIMRSTGLGLLTADNDFDLLQWCQYGFMKREEVTYIVSTLYSLGLWIRYFICVVITATGDDVGSFV